MHLLRKIGDRRLNRIVQFALVPIFLSALLGVTPAQQSEAKASAGTGYVGFKAPAAAPVASVALGVPGNANLGEDFTFTATFSNTSGTPTDAGYGPFIDLVFPNNGADGNRNTSLPLDGINFVSATFLGTAVVSTVLTFPGSGPGNTCVNHPYAVAPVTGLPLQVCGVPGDTLVVLQLPFGSFVPGQPAAVVSVTAHLSNLADVGTALAIHARGGYQFGATPTNDWCCAPFDATILSQPSTNSTTWAPSSSLTPSLISITKAYNGPEDETATGPNFPHTYTVSVDVATGQTVTNLDVTDTLPNNMQFIALVGTAPASSAISTPSTVVPGGTLTRRFASITGVAGADATVTFSFFIPRLDASSAVILPVTTGAQTTSNNNASLAANWTPIDVRDAATPIAAVCGPPCHTLQDKSIAIQKTVANIIDIGYTGNSPGDTLEYTLQFQVSDFFTYGAIQVADILSDGQRITGTPTLSVTDRDGTFLGNFTLGSDFTIDNSQVPFAYGGDLLGVCGDGRTRLNFDVSQARLNFGGPDGILTGGRVAGIDPGAVGTITFRTVIQQDFACDFPSGDRSVDHGDILRNDVTINGEVYDNATQLPQVVPQFQSDISQSQLNVAFGALSKNVYAVNGVVCGTAAAPAAGDCSAALASGVKPTDTLTFRLYYTQPSSDFEQTVLTDYLPLPIFDATEVTTFSNTVCGTPAAGNACLGPGDTYHALNGPPVNEPNPVVTPALATSASANTVAFTYPAYDSITNTTSFIDLLFTVTVTNQVFADGLFLTNQANSQEGTTNAGSQALNQIFQIKIDEPVLIPKKSAVSTDSTSGQINFTPAIGAPIVFDAPGLGPGPGWTGGVISSNYLAANPIDADLTGIDAGDLVKFAIVIENQGHSIKGAFDIAIKDSLPPEYLIPGTGLNLNVYLGDGTTAITYTDLGGGIFGNGIQLDDPGAPGQGACQAHNPTSGKNVVIITYDLELSGTTALGQSIINTATLTNYASEEGGPNFIPSGLSDNATLTPIATPTKSIVTTSEASTSEAGTGTIPPLPNNPRLVTIGEIVRYRLTVNVAEGIVPNLRLTDLLPTGLIFLNDNTAMVAFVSTSGAVTSTTLSGAGLNQIGDQTTVASIIPTFVLPDTAVSTNDSTSAASYAADNADAYVSGTDVFFKFGDVTNPDRDNNNQEFVVVEFNAVVANVAGNNSGTTRDNTTAYRTGSSSTNSTVSNVMRVRIVQPAITFTKTIVSLPSPLDAGGVVHYRITYSNGVGANVTTAFDVNITDALAAVLLLPSTGAPDLTVSTSGTVGAITNSSTTSNVNFTVASVAPGASVTIDYFPVIQDTATAGQIIANTSSAVWTSLPGSGTSPNATGSVAGAPGTATGERNGTGGVNNYSATSTRNFTIASPTITKQIVSTSEATTSGNSVAIGEQINYAILVTFPEGTTPADAVVDNLPAGLQLVPGSPSIITTAAGSGGLLSADFNATIGAQSITAAAGSVHFNFTNIIVAGDNITTNNTILLIFSAQVSNILANQAGTVLSNTASNQVGVSAPVNSNTVNATVVEAQITFGKTIVSLPVPIDAGGVVHYRITYSNGVGANVSSALDVNITDALPAVLLLPSTGAPDVQVTATAGVGAITNNSTTSNVNFAIASVAPGASVTIDYFPVIQGTITPGQLVANVANTNWTSLTGVVAGERTGAGGVNDYFASSGTSFNDSSGSISKQITATSAALTSGNNVVIGEVITYSLLVTLPEGTTPADTVFDDLPAGLELVPGSPVVITTAAASGGLLTADFNATIGAQSVTPVLGDGGSVQFDFTNVVVAGDNVTTNNTMLLQFQARVTNVAGNQNATVLSNSATNTAGAAVSSSNTVSATVVEAVLDITKTASDPNPAVGQVVTFTININHDATSTADAEDVLIVDDLPVGLTIVPATLNATTGGTVTNMQTTNSVGSHIEVSADSIALGGSIQITFDATVVSAYAATFPNTGIATWTSLPGVDSNERTGSQTPALNDYRATSAVTINVVRALAKDLVATDVATTTSPDVTIGEILTYQIVLTIPSGNTDTAIVTDTLDTGLAFVDCSTSAPVGVGQMHDIVAGPDITSSNFIFAVDGHGHRAALCAAGTLPGSNPLISNSGGTIRWDFGTIRNSSPTTAETLTLTYRVIVLDTVANQNNVQLSNNVAWTFTGGRLATRATPSVNIVTPQLQVMKTVDPAAAAIGSLVTYSITVSHTSASLTAAHDVLVTDGIPTGLTLVPGSIVVNGTAGLPAATINQNATQFSVYWPTFGLGESAVITFQAAYLGPDAVVNTTTTEWKSIQIDPVPPPGLPPVGAPVVALSAFNALSTARFFSPADALNNFVAAASVRLAPPPRLPFTGFEPGVVTWLPNQPDDLAYTQLGDLWLEIPKLGVKIDIVGVPYAEDNWNLTWLAGNAGYLEGTAYPTHAGNSGITAHAYLADGTPGPFVHLDQLGYGDVVIVHMGGQKYVYQVQTNQRVNPASVSVLRHEDLAWLTLITCKSYNEAAKDYLYRQVARAVLVRVESE